MRTTTQLVPLAITVAVVGVITWLLLDGDVALGRWLLAALILGHGLAHIAFVVPRPEPAPAAGPSISAGHGWSGGSAWIWASSAWRAGR